MTSYLPFIFLGVTVGSVYALAGVGLVLTYKTAGTFNFAYGALGSVAAYLFYELYQQHHIPWPVAAVISVLVLGTLLGIAFERFGRGLSRTPMAWRIAATVSILISIDALFTIIYGSNTRTFNNFLPNSTFTLFGATGTYSQVIITAISLSAMLGLSIFFRITRAGIAMRGVVDDPDLLDLAGTKPTVIRQWAWIISCMFATLSGLLLAPSVGLSPTSLTLLIVQAFGAAAIGGFSNLPMTWVGGLLIGIVGSLITKFGFTGTLLGGVAPSLPFIILFLVLVFSPRSRLAVKEIGLSRPAIAWRSPNRVQIGIAVVVLIFFAFVPDLVGFEVTQWTLMLTDVILFLSLGLLMRSAGQVSLCQVSFAAIGAAAFSKLAVGAGLPWPLALLVCGLVVVPIGAILAIPAIRFSGLYLALATFGFAFLLENMFYNTNFLFGFDTAGLSLPKPGISWLQSPTEFYYLVLFIAVLFAILTVILTRTRLGRLLRGISDSPMALSAQGTSVNVTLIIVFCFSAFMAAISGALSGMTEGSVTGANFDPFAALIYVPLVLVAAGTTPWYAIAAAAAFVLIPVYIPSVNTLNYLSLTFAVSVILIALRGQPTIFRGLKRKIDRRFRPEAKGAGELRRTKEVLAPIAASAAEPTILRVDEATVRFGGLVAVTDCSLEVTSGQLIGLIGPNGAGKSTTLNVCSGLKRPTSGRVFLGGRDISRLGAAARARFGLGRTFQQMELFETLTVRENVVLGREGSMAGSNVVAQMFPRPADHAKVQSNVNEAIERCGLGPLVDRQVASLSTGQRRLVEVARCLAGPFRILLLDEPSAGLDQRETKRLGAILKTVVSERQVGILLVEHDMSLVMSICDDIYVMEYGEIICQGSPAYVQANEVVRAAYLGEEIDFVEAAD